MNAKPSFFESDVCTSRLHCQTCRSRHTGRIWRGALGKAFRLPGVDFDCPEGKAWIEDRATTNSADTPRRAPCGNCGKQTPTTTEASSINEDTDNSLSAIANPPLYGETRASCMECVEKHIGAAMVLLSETQKSYPYYLLAIGHLHEAEEESVSWRSLSITIRSARKELQTTGAMPNWEKIIDVMKLVVIGNAAQ